MDNSIEATLEDRVLIEVFMDYPNGYLSRRMRWNDVMLIVSKINSLEMKLKEEQLILRSFCNYIIPIYNSLVEINIEKVFNAIVNYLKWYNSLNLVGNE